MIHPLFLAFLKRLSALRLMAILLLCCGATVAQAQQRAGEITQLQGMAIAQRGTDAPRFLTRGDPVFSGDVLSTTDRGYAVVTLADGTKFTLRPSTTFVLENFAHNQGTETAFMRLLKGGMRVVTGLVGRRNPGGVELRTTTATVGIRGTSFDARICGEDCRTEGVAADVPGSGATPGVAPGAAAGAAAAPLPPVVARLVQVSGDVTATLPGRPLRNLANGAALYEGDSLRTSAGAVAVIGFRDRSRMSVNPNSVIRIDSFVYNRPQAADSMAVGLLKGGLRIFTGLIGRNRPEAFTVKTTTATVGIRGTGADLSCEGPCVDPSLGPPVAASPDAESNPTQNDGLFLFTWEGGTYFLAGPVDVPLGRVGFIGPANTPRLLAAVPAFFENFGSPRPDGVQVDWDNLFASIQSLGQDGLYVAVRDGHVFLDSGGVRIDLGAGESGYVGALGQVQRLSPVPGFMSRDPYPLPELVSQTDIPIFQLFGVTLGLPGQEMCRL